MTLIFLLITLFLCRCSLPLLLVPYPPHTRRHCCPLAFICVCLYSGATSILFEPLAFSPPTIYMSSCSARPPPSYLYNPQNLFLPLIRATSATFISTPPPTPSLSVSLLYIYIYLSIYLLLLTFLSSLSHSLSVSIYLSSTS